MARTALPLPENEAKAVALRGAQLRRRRARIEADAEQLRADTLEFVLRLRPHYTRAQLGDLVGISEPRVAQLLAAEQVAVG
jgi:hypothetical protein